MHPEDAKLMELNKVVCWVESRRGKVKARVETRGRNRPSRGLVFVPWFDEKYLSTKFVQIILVHNQGQTDFKNVQ